jgi:NTP pyrophosphatase (non-canonical NTP hydrolase)
MSEYTFNNYQDDIAPVAIYPEAGTGSAMALAYVGLGLGEAGEIQGKIKKILRDNGGVVTDEIRLEIAKEVGDLLWYVARTSEELGYDLEEIAKMNVSKLKSRMDRGVLGGSGDNR